ncbi:MAG: AraC family transcriptional regulator [Clostridiales bacterium]|nr:MAG: AraC family transcriptional regulator [Clostridiales bacterium]
METTDLNVSDISNRVGYSNISYFHRIFNRNFNVSPKNTAKFTV